MADNVAITAGTGTTMGADEVTDGTLGTVKVAYGKIMDGTLDGTNKLTITAANAAKVDGSAVTQPVSGTVTADTELPAAAALSDADAAAPTVPTVGAYNMIANAGATAATRMRGAGNGLNSTGTGIAASQIIAQFDDSSPTSITENSFGNMRMSANRNLYGTIRDAAGNERGVNVDASNNLQVNLNNGGQALTYRTDNADAVAAVATNSQMGTIARNTVYNGTTWDRMPGDTTGVKIQDGGNSITVDGTVAVSGTVTVDDLAAAPTGSAVPANAQYQGNIANTALPSAATAGNLTGNLSDKFGRSVIVPGTIRDLVGTQTTTISASTSETTIVTAAANIFNDIYFLTVANTSATAVRVDFRDTTAGSVLFSWYVPAGDMRGGSLAKILPQTSVNTNWTIQSSASVTDLRVYAVWEKNK